MRRKRLLCHRHCNTLTSCYTWCMNRTHTDAPLTFFPPRHGVGKWHCGQSGVSRCGKSVELTTSGVREVIPAGTEIKTVHPIFCRKCLIGG